MSLDSPTATRDNDVDGRAHVDDCWRCERRGCDGECIEPELDYRRLNTDTFAWRPTSSIPYHSTDGEYSHRDRIDRPRLGRVQHNVDSHAGAGIIDRGRVVTCRSDRARTQIKIVDLWHYVPGQLRTEDNFRTRMAAIRSQEFTLCRTNIEALPGQQQALSRQLLDSLRALLTHIQFKYHCGDKDDNDSYEQFYNSHDVDSSDDETTESAVAAGNDAMRSHTKHVIEMLGITQPSLVLAEHFPQKFSVA